MNRVPAIFILLGIILIVLFNNSTAAAQMQIGTNLAEVSAESNTPIFVDAFRMAAPWKSRTVGGIEEDSGQEVELHLGWPLVVPFPGDDNMQHIVHTKMPVYVIGEHTLIVRGTGKIRITVAGVKKSYDLTGGQVEIPVQISSINESAGPPTQVYLEILQSPNSNERVSNIHLYPPNLDRNTTFYPDFVASLAPFDVLRFIDWGRIDNSVHGDLKTSLTAKSDPIQAATTGVALEFIIELANATNKDVWYSVPHKAGKNFIRTIAQNFRGTTSAFGVREGGLKDGLKLYIEYSSETWNKGYIQHDYIKATGGGNVDKYTAEHSQYIWNLCLEEYKFEFGNNAKDHLVFVLASQAADPEVTKARIKALDGNGLQPDVIAIAPYFGRSYEAPQPTLSKVLEDAQDDIEKIGTLIQRHKVAAGTIPVVAYAGGQSIVASDNTLDDNDPLVERLAEANRDPRMYNLYLDYLDALNEAKIGLFNHYNHCERWNVDGSWGSLEYLNQPLSEAHKHRAILDWPTEVPPTEPTEDTQPPTAFALSVTNTTTSSVNLAWTQATDNVAVTDYTIYQDGALVNTVSSTDSTTYTITGLISSTDYTFGVVASDAAGNTQKSNIVTITTAAPSNDTEPPTTPVLRVTNQTATSVSLEWTPATDNDQVAFYYLFQGTELIATIEPNITNYTAEALVEVTYTFVVKATDPANNASESSNIVVVKISPDSPAIDRESPGTFQITLAEATPDSLVLNWTTPTDNRGITQYTIYQDGEALESLESSTNSYTFTNLDADSTYTITVVAYDAAGNTSEATFTAVMSDLLTKELPEPEPEISAVQPQKLFSPNNDGQNDTWEIVVAPEYVLSAVQIYNRSGQKIFDAGENYKEEPWDGVGQGEPLATGAYYFIITYFNQEGQFTVTGSVALIR